MNIFRKLFEKFKKKEEVKTEDTIEKPLGPFKSSNWEDVKSS